MDDQRESLIQGAFTAAAGSAVLLAFWVFGDWPWQMLLFLAAVLAVALRLGHRHLHGEVQRAAQRRENSRWILTAWADRNGWSCGADLAAFTTNSAEPTHEERRELLASPLFRGELFAVGRRDGVEVGIVCSTEDAGEAGTAWLTAVLVRLSEERPSTRLRARDIRLADLPESVESVKSVGRELCVRYRGWPGKWTPLDEQVDAAVHLAGSLGDET